MTAGKFSGTEMSKTNRPYSEKNSLTNFNIEFNFKSQTGFASDSINSLLHENSL